MSLRQTGEEATLSWKERITIGGGVLLSASQKSFAGNFVLVGVV